MSNKIILTCTSDVKSFCDFPVDLVTASEVWLSNLDHQSAITSGYTLLESNEERTSKASSTAWQELLVLLAERRRLLGSTDAPFHRIALHSSALYPLSRQPPGMEFKAAMRREYTLASSITVAHLILSGTDETSHTWTDFNVTESVTLRGCHHAFYDGAFTDLRSMKATQRLTLHLEQWDKTVNGFALWWMIALAWVQRSRFLTEKHTFKEIFIRTPDDPEKCKAFEDLWNNTLSKDYTQNAKLSIIPTPPMSLAYQLKQELKSWRQGKLINYANRPEFAEPDDEKNPACGCRFPWNSTGFDFGGEMQRPCDYYGAWLNWKNGVPNWPPKTWDGKGEYECDSDEDDSEYQREENFKEQVDDFEWEWDKRKEALNRVERPPLASQARL